MSHGSLGHVVLFLHVFEQNRMPVSLLVMQRPLWQSASALHDSPRPLPLALPELELELLLLLPLLVLEPLGSAQWRTPLSSWMHSAGEAQSSELVQLPCAPPLLPEELDEELDDELLLVPVLNVPPALDAV